MRAFFACLLFYCSASIPALSQLAGVSCDTLALRLHFCQGCADIDTAIAGNSEAMGRLRTVLDSPGDIVEVSVRGSASPEGNTDKNDTLSAMRAAVMSDLFEPSKVRAVEALGTNWAMLRREIGKCDTKWKSAAIATMANTPEWVVKDGRVVDSRKLRLKKLRKGEAWEYMLDSIFPSLRFAECTIVAKAAKPLPAEAESLRRLPGSRYDSGEKEVVEMTVYTGPTVAQAGSRAAAEQPEPIAADGCGVKLAVKTNMLYDAALIPNLGLELEFARNYSASVNWMYAWWSKNASHRFWRVYGGDIEFRYWWHTPPRGKYCNQFTGHHVGLYGQMLTYDVEFGNRGYQGGRWSCAAGLSYGYSLSLSRYFNIDFTIGIGYLWGEYKKYRVEDDCYVWGSTNNRRWIGPTKAEISLVYVIGGKSLRKGGAL